MKKDFQAQDTRAASKTRHAIFRMPTKLFTTRQKFIAAIALLSLPASVAFVAATPGNGSSHLFTTTTDQPAPNSSADHSTDPAPTDPHTTSAKSEAHSQHTVRISTDTSSSSGSQPTQNVEVEVNGQKQSVPKNGSFYRHYEDDSGQTSIDISVDSSGTNSTQSSSNSSVSIDRYSDSYTDSTP